MKQAYGVWPIFLAAAALWTLVPMAQASESADGGWRFGVGTGLSSFSLDGDVGFPTGEGGVIGSIDLSNSDTSDLVQSAFGLSGFAARDRWTFTWALGKVQLDDSDGGLEAKWDRTQGEVSAIYQFASLGANHFGAQLGARYIKHDWNIRAAELPTIRSPEEDWTDVIVGLTHALMLSDAWTWRNGANYGFGGSEGSYFVQTGLAWQPHEHWRFSLDARYTDTRYGHKSDIDRRDFYYYDVEEPAFGLGFMYVW